MPEPTIVAIEDVEAEEGAGFSIHAEAFERLFDEWAAVHGASGAAGPFQHPAWRRAWLAEFGDGREPVFLAIRRDEVLIGVAAFDMAGGTARELGNPNVRDYAGPLAADGFDNDVALALLDWVAEDMTPRLELWGLRRRDPLVALFEAEAADNGWTLTVEHEAVAPVLQLPGSWDEYLAALPKHDRHELRRKLRHLEAAGTIAYCVTTDPGEIAADLESLFAMMRASHHDKGAFLTPEVEAFFRGLVTEFAPVGQARLAALTLDGAPIARLFTFEDESAVYLYNTGYDPAFAHLAPGLLSKGLAVRDAIERGKQTFDFLRGEEEYKKRLGGEPREIVRLTFDRR